jgi:hypothetical protein
MRTIFPETSLFRSRLMIGYRQPIRPFFKRQAISLKRFNLENETNISRNVAVSQQADDRLLTACPSLLQASSNLLQAF